MHRIIHEGYLFENILYFNFEAERLKPYTTELLNDVVGNVFCYASTG